MAGRLQPITQASFAGGLNIVSNPYLLANNQVWRLRNFILDEHGSLRTRDGRITHTTAPVALDVIHLSYLALTTGETRLVAIVRQAGNNAIYRAEISPWSLAGTTSAIEDTPDAVTAVGKQVIANGHEIPLVYDGSILSRLTAQSGQTVPPGAKHLAWHLGSLWVWNTNPSTTTLDGQSSLRACAVNNISDWPNANQTFISRDDGQVGMGLATYTIVEAGISPLQTLVAFKNFSGYQITGVFGSADFSVQKIKSDMGCIAPRTIQFVSGFGIIRLTHKGFALFDGVNDRLISEEIRPLIFGRDEFSSLDMAAVHKSWAAQSQNPPLYVAACPVSGGSGLERVFIYDLVRRSWAVCDFPSPLHCLANVSLSSNQVILLAGGAAPAIGNTKVYKLFGGDLTDDGDAVPWSFRTKPAFVGSPFGRTFFRRLILDLLFTPDQQTTATVTLIGLSGTRGGTDTFTSPVTTPSQLWGSAIWGQFTWGAEAGVDGRRDFAILRTAPSAYVDVSGSGPVRVRGVEWQARSKPLTRAVV